MKPLIDEKTRERIRKSREECRKRDAFPQSAPETPQDKPQSVSMPKVNSHPEEMAAEKMLTPEQIAELMQVNVRTITNLLKKGEIKGMKVGPRLWRVKESDFEIYQSKGKGEVKDSK